MVVDFFDFMWEEVLLEAYADDFKGTPMEGGQEKHKAMRHRRAYLESGMFPSTINAFFYKKQTKPKQQMAGKIVWSTSTSAESKIADLQKCHNHGYLVPKLQRGRKAATATRPRNLTS